MLMHLVPRHTFQQLPNSFLMTAVSVRRLSGSQGSHLVTTDTGLSKYLRKGRDRVGPTED